MREIKESYESYEDIVLMRGCHQYQLVCGGGGWCRGGGRWVPTKCCSPHTVAASSSPPPGAATTCSLTGDIRRLYHLLRKVWADLLSSLLLTALTRELPNSPNFRYFYGFGPRRIWSGGKVTIKFYLVKTDAPSEELRPNPDISTLWGFLYLIQTWCQSTFLDFCSTPRSVFVYLACNILLSISQLLSQ